jgi:bacterioferritin
VRLASEPLVTVFRGAHLFVVISLISQAHQPKKVNIMSNIDKDKVIAVLNRILEAELAGVVRYTHYSLLVFGYGRIPIVSWLREQADESLLHAQQVGEWVTTLGAYPSLGIGQLLDSHQHDIGAIMRESLKAEGEALQLYRGLLALVDGKSVALEEFARQMIYTEELHAAEVDKMLRKPGDLSAFAPRPV